mmetsp:Transcript_66799/g.110994  ORF Transcript_66799/g.110994 Transcript_66799/m.110994 type:complete len:86 (-) Transcript_66799:25-282(-)
MCLQQRGSKLPCGGFLSATARFKQALIDVGGMLSSRAMCFLELRVDSIKVINFHRCNALHSRHRKRAFRSGRSVPRTSSAAVQDC